MANRVHAAVQYTQKKPLLGSEAEDSRHCKGARGCQGGAQTEPYTKGSATRTAHLFAMPCHASDRFLWLMRSRCVFVCTRCVLKFMCLLGDA
jgi:hypothetical protein